ncbi:hypothetical protein AAG906_001698 [Vitis piasezkii]
MICRLRSDHIHPLYIIANCLGHIVPFLQLSDGAPGVSISMVIAHPSPIRASLLSLCFLVEVTDDGVVVDPIEMIDGVVPYDEYRDEMDMMTMSQITNIVQLQPVSPFDMFGVSTTKVVEETQTIPNPEILEGDRDVETVDFGIEDQPRELKIGSPLSTDERDRLIHLLRSYLDVFAWTYEDMPSLDPSIVQHHLPILPHARLDMEKTTFIIEWVPSCYMVMPFGLKNAERSLLL